MSKYWVLIFNTFILCFAGEVYAQKVAIKTNLLYGAYTYTPNLGMEFGVGKKMTLDLGGGYNPWKLNGTDDYNKKTVHWLGEAEIRYWSCQRFNGHFFGLHVLGSQYNISGHKLPLLFGKSSAGFRYEGYAVGAGISYGYQWILGKRWNIEANIGVGYARLNYDKYACQKCGSLVGKEHRNYFGPTRAGLSLIYIIR